MTNKLVTKCKDFYYINGDIFYISRWGHFNKVKICDDGRYLKCRNEFLHRVLYCFYHNISNIEEISTKCVHHKDGNRYNNSKENLTLIDSSEHTRLHSTGRKHTEVSKQKMSLSRKGVKQSEEHRRKNIERLKQIPWTEERKRHISEAYKNKRPVICIETGERFESIVSAGKKYGHLDMIKLCIKGKAKKAAGFRWKYADTTESN